MDLPLVASSDSSCRRPSTGGVCRSCSGDANWCPIRARRPYLFCLRDRAREAVQHEPLGTVGPLEVLGDDPDNNVVGDQAACVHNRLGGLAHLAAGRHRRAQHVPGRRATQILKQSRDPGLKTAPLTPSQGGTRRSPRRGGGFACPCRSQAGQPISSWSRASPGKRYAFGARPRSPPPNRKTGAWKPTS